MESIEKKFQEIWEKEEAFKALDGSPKPKYYVLEMLPYPSGKIHVGHLRNYSIGDALARFKRAQGYNVLHPMGWDAFGLPAENAAIEAGVNPAVWTEKNIETMRGQLKSVGLSYDWSREFSTCDQAYYGLEQSFFLKLYKKGKAYRKESFVNWDPVDGTVLANEQVIDGKGWRSGAPVERKLLRQWFLRISDYSEELLGEIKNLKGWPEKVRSMQEKWIGRSEGVSFKFSVEGAEDIEVFSTRPETIFGASFIALAYNHPFVDSIKNKSKEITDFIESCSKTGTAAEVIDKMEKEAVFTGYEAYHPFDPSVKLPVIIANFVLMDYGTGALFGCPAHDERDFEIAKKKSLPVKQAVDNKEIKIDLSKGAFTGDGYLINSSFLNGLSVGEAKERIISEMEKLSIGKRTVNYRLKDWGISRQRYWGCPIPIIYCNSCGTLPVPEKDLPVILPMDVKFDGLGNPLDKHPTWKFVECPSCGGGAHRETDTFDTFFESSWYFTRYCSPEAKDMVGKEECSYWMPVDRYIGGIEHAVLHLLYSRFFTKLMNEEGYLKVREPFKNLLTQGMVLHATYKDSKGRFLYPWEVVQKDGKLYSERDGSQVFGGKVEKMSKSKKNVVDLEKMLEEYGADALRLFILSDSPPEKDVEWSSSGIAGASRFISRLVDTAEIFSKGKNSGSGAKSRSSIHKTIKNVTEDIDSYKLNKAIALCRELFNELKEELDSPAGDFSFAREAFEILLRLLNPFIPHITEELWERLGNSGRLYSKEFPLCDESLIVSDSYVLAVQINGKLRAALEFEDSVEEGEIKKKILELPEILKYTEGKEIKKIIIVPKKIVNIVIV